MAQLIQIKRSLNTAVPASLANGELAITANGDVLYVGSNSAIVPVGGKRVPGTLTANQAIVVNATSMIDKIMLGDASINAVVNASSLTLANSTVTWTLVKPTAAQVTDTNYFPAADGTWKQPPGGATSFDGLSDVVITSVANNNIMVYDNTAGFWENHAVGNGFSFADQVMAVVGGSGTIVNTSGINVLANSGIVSNTTGVFVNPNNGIIVNSDGVWVNPNNGIVANSAGVFVNPNNGIIVNSAGVFVKANNGIVANSTGTWAQTANGLSLTAAGINVLGNNGISSNATGTWAVGSNGISVTAAGINVLGGSTLTVNSSGAHVNSALSIQDLTLTGNLSVSGTLTTVDAVNLVVNDSIIALARNNAADTLDIGMYGQYNDGTERFTGLIWDTTDNTWYLFANTTAEPTTTLDTGGTGFTKSTLKSFIDTGALVSNLTSVYITANSTVNVNITANTLNLSTALAGTQGGTGLSSIANNALLLGNSTNGFGALTIGADGAVLQCNATHVFYGSLDGGTF